MQLKRWDSQAAQGRRRHAHLDGADVIPDRRHLVALARALGGKATLATIEVFSTRLELILKGGVLVAAAAVRSAG